MKTDRENETEWQKEQKSNDRQESVMSERKMTETRRSNSNPDKMKKNARKERQVE